MSLTKDREPVEVLFNPNGVRQGDRPHWLLRTQYIKHRNGTLTWYFGGFPFHRPAQRGDWRKVTP